MAGVIFMHADPDDLAAGDSVGDDLWSRWLRAGIEQSAFVAEEHSTG